MNLISFERNVHRYQDRIYGFACSFLHDSAEAQDVAQEVFIRLWKHRQEVDEERLLGWLLRVTRNACIDAIRKRKSYRNVVMADEDQVALAPTHETGPYAAAEAADFQRNVERALEALSEPYRSIVILREMQGLQYDEISGAMDMPLNTVKVYLHRGRKMLRKQLSEVIYREMA